MTVWTMKHVFLVVIPPHVLTAPEKICSQINFSVSDGGQNPRSSFCEKMHSKVDLKRFKLVKSKVQSFLVQKSLIKKNIVSPDFKEYLLQVVLIDLKGINTNYGWIWILRFFFIIWAKTGTILRNTCCTV